MAFYCMIKTLHTVVGFRQVGWFGNTGKLRVSELEQVIHHLPDTMFAILIYQREVVVFFNSTKGYKWVVLFTKQVNTWILS